MNFHAEEDFRICNFEIDHEDNSANPDSDPTSSNVNKSTRDRAQATPVAQDQPAEKNEKQYLDCVANKTYRTISEDLSDGHSAGRDLFLGLLFEDGDNIVLNSECYEDEEIHVAERVVLFQPERTETQQKSSTGSQALQDYQMQLMLLEQQNKKRLLKARGLIPRKGKYFEITRRQKVDEQRWH